MGKRSMTSKMLQLPLSWVAVLRVLKKNPKNLPSSSWPVTAEHMMIGPEMVMKAAMMRYSSADDETCMRGIRQGSRPDQPRASNLLLKMSRISSMGCTSKPHTESFRVHHVVNQEALQLMLTEDDYIRDYANSKVQGHTAILLTDVACRKKSPTHHDGALSRCTPNTLSASCPPDMAGDFDGASASGCSLEDYSTATSASFGAASDHPPETLSFSSSSCLGCSAAISCQSSMLLYGDSNSDQQLPVNYGDLEDIQEEAETRGKCIINAHDHPVVASATDQYAGDFIDAEDDKWEGEHTDEDMDERANHSPCRSDVIVPLYSEDPISDFSDSIAQMVLAQQVKDPGSLEELYVRYLHLNSPEQQSTIAHAFLLALGRLAFFDADLDQQTS